jgi:hypothetical protein
MIPVLLAILAAVYAPLWKMAASKPKSKGKSGANKKSASPIFKKSASPIFKKSDSPVSVKDSGCVDIMYEILKAYDGKAHVICYHLRKGATDGFSKPINDAIASGDLANDCFNFADSPLRVSHDVDEPKLTSKGFHHRCFPQFIGDSDVPDTLEGCLATCKRLKAVLSAPANNRFNTTYRISADNNLTQNPPRSADFVLTTSTILQIIGHKYEVEQGQTFYGMFPELASIYFTPNPTYPHQAISELGYPAGNAADNIADNVADDVADDVGDDIADNEGGGD